MDSVNPRVDIAFKKIFGVEENKDLLISLINAVVSEEDQVSEVTLLNPYNPKNYREDKLSILDIKAENKEGRRFNIEIQITDEADYNKRALYYWAKLYTEQLKESDSYSSLSKAIGIHILNFTSIPESDEYHNVFHIVEKSKGFQYFKDLELHTVELRKFTEKLPNDTHQLINKIKSSLDIWATFLTKHNILDKNSLPKNFEKLGLKKALTVLEVMHFNAEERDGYESHLKWLRLQSSALLKMEQQGFEQGMEQGMEKGMEKGIEKGIEKGMEKKAFEMVMSMLKENESIEKISKYTGLSINEVLTIKNSILARG